MNDKDFLIEENIIDNIIYISKFPNDTRALHLLKLHLKFCPENINVTDNLGRTPLFLACQFANSVQSTEFIETC